MLNDLLKLCVMLQIDDSESYLKIALEGIEYFQIYYQYWLLFMVTLSMLGWIVFLQQNISSKRTSGHLIIFQWKSFVTINLALTFSICLFIYRKIIYSGDFYSVVLTVVCFYCSSKYSFIGGCIFFIAHNLLDAMLSIQSFGYYL